MRLIGNIIAPRMILDQFEDAPRRQRWEREDGGDQFVGLRQSQRWSFFLKRSRRRKRK